MKKSLIFCLLAALAIGGCQVKEEIEFAPEGEVFKATLEAIEVVSDQETKTTLNNEGDVIWKRGDQVSIFVGTTSNGQFQVTDASDGKTAASLNPISIPGGGSAISTNVAFYPYHPSTAIKSSGSSYVVYDFELPSLQNYAEDSFGSGSFPMAAVTSSTRDYNLKFKNVLGGLKLRLKGTATIAAISIRGNNNEVLCGDAAVTLSSVNAPSINLTDASAKSVTLVCGEGVQLDVETATSFIIALPPMTFTGGFTIVVTDNMGLQKEIKTTRSQTIARSNVLSMPEVTYSGTYVAHDDVLVQIKDFDLPDGVNTKTALTMSETKGISVFTDSDVLRIYPLSPTGNGVRFAAKENSGSACLFNGSGFGLRGGKSYAAYYPGRSFPVPPATAVPVDYTGQAMSAKGAWDLSGVDYLVFSAPAITSTFNFSMKHVGALLIMDVTFPSAATYNRLSLTSEDTDTPFVTAGTMDLTADPIAVAGTEFNKTINLALGGASGISVEANETVRFCMMVAPVDMSGKSIVLNVNNGISAVSAEVDGSNFKAGKAYKILCSPVASELPEEPVDTYINLSENGTANTYIVSEAGDYSIDVIKAGNGKKVTWDSGFASSAYPEYNARTGVKNFEGDGVVVTLNQNGCVSNVSYSDGKILFTATGTEGNAKLTLTYGGEYVWTWVIWCTDEPAVHPFTYEGITYHIMDRNLGATSDGSDNATIEELSGLYYQFGNPLGYTFEEFANASVDPVGQLVGTMKYALADHPNCPTLDISQDYYWFSPYKSSKGNSLYGKLWGAGGNFDDDLKCGFENSKTLYDPCPVGYKVMGWDTFSGFETISSATAYGIYLPVDDGNLFIPYNGAAWTTGIFWMGRGPYPCTIDGVGGPYANLWTSGHNARNMGYYSTWYAKDVNRATYSDPGDGHITARGLGVRCIEDEDFSEYLE